MNRCFGMLAVLVLCGVATAVAQPPGGDDGQGGPPGGGRGPRRGGDDDHGRPVEKIAKELGVTPEKFREVFKRVQPGAAARLRLENSARPTAESWPKGWEFRPRSWMR